MSSPASDSPINDSRTDDRRVVGAPSTPLPTGGTHVLLVTPFDEDGEPDTRSLAALVDHVLAGGAQGVVALGTTGEFFTLTGPERAEVMAVVVKAVDDRVPVTVGVGAEGTATAVDLARTAQRSGADCVMALPPIYFSFTPGAQSAHFRAIARAVDLPVMIYDGSGGIPVPAAVIAAVADVCPNVVHAKLALPDPSRVTALVRQAPGVVPFVGDDTTLVAALRAGARGSAIATGNIQVMDVVAVHDAFARGDRHAAVATFAARIAPSLAATSTPKHEFIARFKEVLVAMGVIASARVRSPLEPVAPDDREELLAVMAHLGIV